MVLDENLSLLSDVSAELASTVVILLLALGSVLQHISDKNPFAVFDLLNNHARPTTNRWISVFFFGAIAAVIFAVLYPDNKAIGMKLVALTPVNLYILLLVDAWWRIWHDEGRGTVRKIMFTVFAPIGILLVLALHLAWRIYVTFFPKVIADDCSCLLYFHPPVMCLGFFIWCFFCISFGFFIFAVIACGRLDVHLLLLAELIGVFGVDYVTEQNNVKDALRTLRATVLEIVDEAENRASGEALQAITKDLRLTVAQSDDAHDHQATHSKDDIRWRSVAAMVECHLKSQQNVGRRHWIDPSDFHLDYDLFQGMQVTAIRGNHLCILTPEVFAIIPPAMDFESTYRTFTEQPPVLAIEALNRLLPKDSRLLKIHRRVQTLRSQGKDWNLPLRDIIVKAGGNVPALQFLQQSESSRTASSLQMSSAEEKEISMDLLGPPSHPAPSDAVIIGDPNARVVLPLPVDDRSADQKAKGVPWNPEHTEALDIPASLLLESPILPSLEHKGMKMGDSRAAMASRVLVKLGSPRVDISGLVYLRSDIERRLCLPSYQLKNADRDCLYESMVNGLTKAISWTWSTRTLSDTWFTVWAGTRAVVMASIAFDQLTKSSS